MDMFKLFILFICCCYPALAWEKTKNPIQFTSTFPKEVQVLLHQDITITCPKLKGGTKDMQLMFFYRFQSNGPGQKEVFINQSSGQYVIDTKHGVLTIKRFDKQNEGKYSCAALATGLEGRVTMSSSFKMYIGDQEAMMTADDSLIRIHPHDEVVLLPISRPEVSFDEGNKPPLLSVSWTVQQELPSSEDFSNDPTNDLMIAPITEPYSEFVIQMKHYTTFVEDWHNLSRIDNNQEGPQSYNVALSEFETGYGEYRILGMTKSGRSSASELSEGLRIDLKTSTDHLSDHDHGGPGETMVDRREDIPPVITRAAALSDHSILLEWTFDDYYTGGDTHINGFVVQYSQVHGQPSSGSSLHVSGSDSRDKLSQAAEVFLETPNLRMHVIQNLVPNTQYQFRIKAVGPNQWATIYSQAKFAITSKDSWAISGQGTSINPENDVDRKLENYLTQHGKKDNHLVLMLVVGGCVCLILIAIIVSVSILAIYRQRLNNSITNKIIMREMEEEMKRRESTLRKSVGGVAYHELAAALQQQQQHQQQQIPSPSTTPQIVSIDPRGEKNLPLQTQPLLGAPAPAPLYAMNNQTFMSSSSASPHRANSLSSSNSSSSNFALRTLASAASKSSCLIPNRLLLSSFSSCSSETATPKPSLFVGSNAATKDNIFCSNMPYDCSLTGSPEHQMHEGSSSFTSPRHSQQSSNVTALSLGESASQVGAGTPNPVVGVGMVGVGGKYGGMISSLIGDMMSTGSTGGGIATSVSGCGGGGASSVAGSSSCSEHTNHNHQHCACQSSTHANMEQSSVLGSGCSEHSVNSSPIGCDDSSSSNHGGTSMMNRHSVTPPMISPGSVSIAAPTSLYNQTRIPNMISLPSSGAITGYPVLPLIPSSLVTSSIGSATIHEAGVPGGIIAPIPQSRYDSSLVYNTMNELREYLPSSNLPSPTVSNITLPQPLKTLHSPALFSKYSSPMPQQNYPTNSEFTSFKALRDLTTNSGAGAANPGNLLRGISPKSSLLPRTSVHNYTIDEDDQTMSNYQGLPLTTIDDNQTAAN